MLRRPQPPPHLVFQAASVLHHAQHRRHAVGVAAVVQYGEQVDFLAQCVVAVQCCGREGRGQGGVKMGERRLGGTQVWQALRQAAAQLA